MASAKNGVRKYGSAEIAKFVTNGRICVSGDGAERAPHSLRVIGCYEIQLDPIWLF
jgi:hypothetical protein